MFVKKIWEAKTIDDLRQIIASEGYSNKIILSDDDPVANDDNMLFMSECVAFSIAYCKCMDTVSIPSKGKEFLYSYVVTGISEFGEDYKERVEYLDTGIICDEYDVDFYDVLTGDKQYTGETLYKEVLKPIIDGTDTTTIGSKSVELLNKIHRARKEVYHYSEGYDIINDGFVLE